MAEISRNSDCPCGSRKKYKKCCLSRGVSNISLSGEHNDSKEDLVRTFTNELFQPMRLYYKIHHRLQLETKLSTLRCMEYNVELDDWILKYEAEAAHIGLEVLPEAILFEAKPIILATFYLEAQIMLIDIRSIERAARVVEWLNCYIPREIAEITDAAIFNRLITSSSRTVERLDEIDFDELFNEKQITVINPEKTFARFNAIMEQYEDKQYAMEVLAKKNLEEAKKPLPVIEKLPVYYYDEGIETFENTFQLRQFIALKHFLGDEKYSFYDLMQDIFHHVDARWVV